MASFRVLYALIAALVAFTLVVSAERTRTTTTSPTGAVAGVFETTFRPFPTAVDATITTTIVHPTANPTESFVGYYYPIRQGIDVQEGISYIINTTSSENNVALYCWYPVSVCTWTIPSPTAFILTLVADVRSMADNREQGNWGLLPRILFYVTIIAALTLRHHQWLYAGALVASLTYSGVAAIQACLMVWHGPSFGDTDMIPLLAILATSCTLTVPLLNWSDTLRNIGKDEDEVLKARQRKPVDPGEKNDQQFDAAARTIILYWAFLVLVGFICVFVALVPLSYAPIWHNWSALTDSGNTNITCTPPNGVLDLQAGQGGDWDLLSLTSEFIDANGCTNPCSIPAADNLAIFRSASDLAPVSLTATLRFILQDETNRNQRNNDIFSFYYFKYGLLLLPYIFLQGLWAAIFGRRTPGQARNVVYAYLTRVRFWRPRSPKQRTPLEPASPLQKSFAKWMAMLSYLWAVFVLILSIPLVIINVCAAEIFMVHFPASEDNNHVGAWSPWTSVAMALLAGMTARYHNQIGYYLALGFHEVVWLMAHPAWVFRRFCGGSGRGGTAAKNIFTGDLEKMPEGFMNVKTAEGASWNAFVTIAAFTVVPTIDAFHSLAAEWRQLVDFYGDPDMSRGNQGRIHRLQATECGCILGCRCPPGWVAEECRHEQGACFKYTDCVHDPPCEHTSTCVEAKKHAQRLHLFNPERRTVALALGPIHGGRLALDITGTPIPVRPEDDTVSPMKKVNSQSGTPFFSQRPLADSDSDMEDKTSRISTPRWHDSTHERHSTQYRSSIRRMLSRKSRYSRVSSITPASAGRDAGEMAISPHSIPEQTSQDQAQSNLASMKASRTVRVSEKAVHPMLRDSFVSQDEVSPVEENARMAAPPRAKISAKSQSAIDRRKSMAKDLPSIPDLPRTPHPTPSHDTRSLASEGVSALSPVLPSKVEHAKSPDEDSISPLRPSTNDTRENSSGNVTKRSMSNTSPEEEDPTAKVEEGLGRMRSTTGLTSSFEQGIMSRHRRSVAYGPDIPRDRSAQTSSSSAPIPVHMEEPDEVENGYMTHAELPATRTPSEGHMLAPPFSDVNEEAELESPASVKTAEELVPEQPRPVRHISQLIKLPEPDRGSGIFLSPQEKHALLDPPSTASTPPITLPALSPPDPDSNVARAQFLGSYGVGSLSLSGVVSRLQALDTPSANAPIPRSTSYFGPDLRSSSIPEGAAGIEQAVQRQKSPRPSGYRSTVDYLQVHRPSTVAYADEITLRKDEFGVYQLVINGAQIIQPPRAPAPANEGE